MSRPEFLSLPDLPQIDPESRIRLGLLDLAQEGTVTPKDVRERYGPIVQAEELPQSRWASLLRHIGKLGRAGDRK